MVSPFLSVVDAASSNGNSGESKSYISGYTETEFKPEYKVTRAEIATMMARKLDYKESSPSFTDVNGKSSHWASGYIGALTDKKILSGYSDGSFRPDNNIERGELAKVLDSVYKAETKDNTKATSTSLNDISGHWAESNIKNMERLKVLNGYNGNFRPQDALTREEAVTAINKLIRVIDERANREYNFMFKVKNKFADMDVKRWSYAEVLDASTNYTYKKSDNKEYLVKTAKSDEEYKFDFSGNEVQNREDTLEVLNLKRESQGLSKVEEDVRFNELSKRVASADAKSIKANSIIGDDLGNLMDAIGINKKTPPQRGSSLFKTNKKDDEYITDLLDDTLFAGQYIERFDRLGVASVSDSSTGYTSFVANQGVKENVDDIEYLMIIVEDTDPAKEIFQSVKSK